MRYGRIRLLSSILLLTMLLSVFLTACHRTQSPSDETGQTPDETYQTPESEYTIPKEPGFNQITFYWSYPGEIKNADVWVW